jgi:CMP-N-acetylneuraminic acid synthetase
MTCIAIIPARGGSKGIPQKNLAEINGRSLVVLAINAALQSGVIDSIVVTSDDTSILEIAEKSGAIAIRRPAELATDSAAIEDALIHAINQYSLSRPEPQVVVLLQPTSPLRKASTISQALQVFNENGCTGSVYGVTECEHHPFKSLIVDGNTLSPVREVEDLSRSRQTLPRAFRQSGSIYVVSSKEFQNSHSLFNHPVQWIEVDQDEALDIDTVSDLETARQIARNSDV